MADGPGQPVHNRLLILVNMAMGVGNSMGVKIGVIVLLFQYGIVLPFVNI